MSRDAFLARMAMVSLLLSIITKLESLSISFSHQPDFT
jgi:hypothetical protein